MKFEAKYGILALVAARHAEDRPIAKIRQGVRNRLLQNITKKARDGIASPIHAQPLSKMGENKPVPSQIILMPANIFLMVALFLSSFTTGCASTALIATSPSSNYKEHKWKQKGVCLVKSRSSDRPITLKCKSYYKTTLDKNNVITEEIKVEGSVDEYPKE